jgi:hypothetical protein
LHSGSKKGPTVKKRKQAIAIGLSEARKAGERVATPKGKGDTQSYIAGRGAPKRRSRAVKPPSDGA